MVVEADLVRTAVDAGETDRAGVGPVHADGKRAALREVGGVEVVQGRGIPDRLRGDGVARGHDLGGAERRGGEEAAGGVERIARKGDAVPGEADARVGVVEQDEQEGALGRGLDRG